MAAPRKIEMREFDLPRIGPEEGLLKVEMCGVCATDYKAFDGKFDWLETPMILGHEVAGHIVEIGAIAAERWGVKKGDRIVTEPGHPCRHCHYCSNGMYRWCENRLGWRVPCKVPPHIWGGYGQYQYLPPGAQVYKVCDNISPEAAVLINAVIANGIQWVRFAGKAAIGDVVVIIGMGAQSMAATIAAKEAGASPIIVVGLTSDEPRFEIFQRFGADYMINAEKENAIQMVNDLTHHRRADIVVEVSGSPDGVAQSIELVRVKGTVVCCSVLGSTVKVPLITDKIALNEITFQGVFTNDRQAMRAAIKIVESGRYPVEKIVTHHFPLEKAQEALKASGGELTGVSPIRSVLVP